MSSELLVQSLFNGMMLSLVYILIALGLTLVFGIMLIVNFAHGEIYMLGAMTTFYLAGVYGINYFAALGLAVLAMIALGLIMERVLFRPTLGNFDASLVVSLGLLLVLQSSALLLFGTEDKNFPSPFQGVVHILGATVALERLAILPFAIALIAGLLAFIQKAKAGKAMRAVAQDAEAAGLMGIDVGRTSALAMAIGFALAAAAGGLTMPIFLAEPFMGGPALLKAFIIIVVGGMGSIAGVVVAGVVLGLVDSFCATLFGGPVTALVSFLLLIGILLIRPTGLMGHKGMA